MLSSYLFFTLKHIEIHLILHAKLPVKQWVHSASEPSRRIWGVAASDLAVYRIVVISGVPIVPVLWEAKNNIMRVAMARINNFRFCA